MAKRNSHDCFIWLLTDTLLLMLVLGPYTFNCAVVACELSIQVTNIYVFSQSKEIIHTQMTLSKNAQHACEFLNHLPGMSCQPAMAGVFLYPCLDLPSQMIEEAKVRKLSRRQVHQAHSP